LLATLALTVGTSYLINNGKVRFAWVTIVPMCFVGTTTITGGIMNLVKIYIPQMLQKATMVLGTINTVLTIIILVCVVMIILEAVPKWFKAGRLQPASV
jgi:carbon starvation protein